MNGWNDAIYLSVQQRYELVSLRPNADCEEYVCMYVCMYLCLDMTRVYGKRLHCIGVNDPLQLYFPLFATKNHI